MEEKMKKQICRQDAEIEKIKESNFDSFWKGKYDIKNYVLKQERARSQELVEALEKISNRKQYSCECVGEGCSCDFSMMQFTAEEALKKYHSEIT